MIGKTNMDEFAMGSTTETSYYGVTKNPWNPEHVPGGSSGGSCAAVAALESAHMLLDLTPADRSVSQVPYCGVVGIKPTYGTVSRYGLIAYGSSLDQIGPVAKDVTDCATVLEAIASHDVKDSTSVEREDTNFTSCVGRRCKRDEDWYSKRLFWRRSGRRSERSRFWKQQRF